MHVFKNSFTYVNDKCIYLSKSRNDLSYKNQEHIIPAGLGGKTKLAIGMVSDQANKLFSKYELKALRNTLLSINRNNVGPGKRGSLSITKVKDPQINLVEAISDEENNQIDTEYAPIKLGFLFMGTLYIIPQILFPINDDWSIKLPRLIMENISKDPSSSTYCFLYWLQSFISNKNRKYILIKSELKRQDKYVIIGKHNNKWFINTTLNDKNLEKFLQVLEKKPLPEDIPAIITSRSMYKYSNSMPDAFDKSMSFVYFKTAFNTLAFFKGSEFVLATQFDEARNAIINLKNMDRFSIIQTMPTWLINWVNDEVKPNEHFVVINAENNYIDAYVSFYRKPLNAIIRLSNNYAGTPFRNGFICNWKDSTEHSKKLL